MSRSNKGKDDSKAAGHPAPSSTPIRDSDSQVRKEKKRKRAGNEGDEVSKSAKKAKKVTALDAAVAETRSASDEIPAEPGAQARAGTKSRKEKKSKRLRESNKEAPAGDTTLQQDVIRSEDATSDVEPSTAASVPITKKARKDAKRDEKKAKKAAKADGSAPREDAMPQGEGNIPAQEGDNSNTAAAEDVADKKGRFIVFVGNLPYTATKASIQTHFEKIQPTEVRIMTDKATKKPKGFAFVEFDRFDRMETCLKKYQHSVFPDGKKGRKINVELTAGGGGNTASRKSKIEARNLKLHDERQRDREKREILEEKQSERKEKKNARQKKDLKGSGNGNGAEGSDGAAETSNGIHPSRLAMMNAPAKPWQDKRSRY